MTPFNPGSMTRQRGVTLIEVMVGLIIGMLVVLVALSSVLFTRSSARVMTDSAGLEQQATLVMTQIGQQIRQAGAINGYPSGADPNQCTTTDGGCASVASGLINFDTRAFGGIPANIFGTTGGGPDTLVITYARPNDGSLAFNCIGQDGPGPGAPYTVTGTGQAQVVNEFSVDTSKNNLMCGDTVSSVTLAGTRPSGNTNQPIASNVMDMRIRYLQIAASGNVTYMAANAVSDWSTVNGLQVCLEMQGDPTGAPDQKYTNCQGADTTSTDGRIHRIVKQTFSMRNFN